MNKVSLIVPIYNSEKYLKRCIDSIVNQTFENIEIICIDDGSTDKSLKVLNAYAIKDSRIKIYSQQNNGISFTRNRGIQLASCKYIMFIDSDDTIELTMIEKLYNRIEETSSDLVISNFNYIDRCGVLYKKYKKFKSDFSKRYIFQNILNGNLSTSPCISIYNKNLFLKNNVFFPISKIYEDSMTIFKLLYYAKKVSVVEDCLYNYFDNEESISTSFDEKNFKDIVYNIKITKKFLEEEKILEEYYFDYLMKIRALIDYIIHKIGNNIEDINEKYFLFTKMWASLDEVDDIKKIHFSKLIIWIYNCEKSINFIYKFKSKFFDEHWRKKFDKINLFSLGLSNLSINYLLEKGIKKVYLYGAGDLAKKIIEELKLTDIEVLGIIDSNVSEGNSSFQGFLLSNPTKLNLDKKDYILISSESFAYEISCNIQSYDNLKNANIVSFYSVL